MQDLEKRSVTNNNDIKTWKRYVDGIFATVKKDKTENILQTINNTTKGIKFTKEEEQNNKLAFLDVLLTKTNNGTIHTEVYRKKTHTDQILNHNSNHPTQHKISCVRTLFNRINTHCNTENAKSEERKYLYTTFAKNNYPKTFINKILNSNRTLTKTTNDGQNRETTETRTRVALPYIHTTSKMTARLLRQFNIDVAHKPTHKLRSYFTKHKDKTQTTQTSNAIYIIPCNNCSRQYIGQTSKKIETRLTEHKNAINRRDLLSLPATHTYDNGHTFNWTETKLLGRANTKHAREFKEAWYSTDRNTINRYVDIPTVYLQLKYSHSTNNSTTSSQPVQSTSSVDINNSTHITQETESSMATHPHTTNEVTASSNAPIRRSSRIQERNKQHELLNPKSL